MIVEAEVSIRGSRAAVWAAIANIEHAAEFIHGIEKIELVEKPAHGLVGLRWRETRILFGKAATVEKWISDATENDSYTTRAESDGFVFTTTKRLSESGGSITLREAHESIPQSLAKRLMMIPMVLFFRGVIKKALLQDLMDIKTAVEQG